MKKPGIDRIKLYNVQIVAIVNMVKLAQHPNAELYGTAQYKTQTGYIQGWKIKNDGLFTDFYFAGQPPGKTAGVQNYAVLDFSPTNVFGINLDNLTVEEICMHLDIVQIHLEREYGIIADFSHVKIKYIEINSTIQTEKAFAAYERSIRLIMCNVPPRLKTISYFGNAAHDGINWGSFCRGNKSEEIIIYDKRAELYKKTKQDMDIRVCDWRLS